MKLDMHFHSTDSDGAVQKEDLAKKAFDQKLDFIALTDHDIVSHDFGEYLQEYNIPTCKSVEISACNYEHDKSLHITFYAKEVSQKIDEVLFYTRTRKQDLILGQILQFQQAGFLIQPKGFFDFYEKQGRGKDALNKFDIAYYLFLEIKNRVLAQHLIGKKDIDFLDFYLIFLKKGGEKYQEYAYLIPEYEPDIQDCAEWNQEINGVLALAHPNVTFKKGIEEFESVLPHYIEKGGMNAVEINALATKEWVESILTQAKKYNLFVTFGSDFHTENIDDGKHGKFGQQNLFISGDERKKLFEKYKERLI